MAEFTPYVFLWESSDGSRHWEAVPENQFTGFIEKLLVEGVHPATVMCARLPIFFHWVWKKYHNNLSDVHFGRINDKIYGSEPVESKHEVVDVPRTPEKPTSKYGWIAPDGRYFQCEYSGHRDLASKIVGALEDVWDAEKYLEEKGWAKVFKGMETRTHYSVGMGLNKKLTDAQFKTLQREGLENSIGVSFLLL